MGCRNCLGHSNSNEENEFNVVNANQNGRLRAKRKNLEESDLKDINKVVNTTKTNSKVYAYVSYLTQKSQLDQKAEISKYIT